MSHPQKSKAVGTSNTLSDVYKAVGYSQRAGVQSIQRLVPDKYKMRLRDVNIDLDKVDKSVHFHPDTVLLKEPAPTPIRYARRWCKNLHDAFVNVDGALEMVVRSRKPKAVALVKWLTKKGVEKLQEDHQKAIEERDTRIQAIEYENVGLQGEIRNARRTITDLIANRHVPRSGAIDTVLVVVEKNADEDTIEHKRAKNFDKYMLRCQKKQVDERLSVLRAKYPNMVILEPRCDDGNAIHVWNRFKQRVLTKENYYRNHFRLPPDAEELFEDMFGILV